VKKSLQLHKSPGLLLTPSFLLIFFPAHLFLSSIYHTLCHSLSDTSSHMHLHAYLPPVSSNAFSSVKYFMSIGASFGNRTSDRDDPSQWKEGIVLGARGRRSCNLRNGNVRYSSRATSNALVEDSPKKSMQGHHDAFARVGPDCWVFLLIHQCTS
jgi:hypothetical protein